MINMILYNRHYKKHIEKILNVTIPKIAVITCLKRRADRTFDKNIKILTNTKLNLKNYIRW